MKQLLTDWHFMVPFLFAGFLGARIAIGRFRSKEPTERYHVPKGSHLFRPPSRPSGPKIAGRK